MKKNAIALVSIAFALSAVAPKAHAQDAGPAIQTFCPSYGQASVQVTVAPLPSKAIAGATLPVDLVIRNFKGYPLSGGTVILRLVSLAPSDKALAGMAGSVFARTVAANNVFIASHAEKGLSLALAIPSRIPSGQYEVEAVYALSEADLNDADAAPQASRTNSGSASLAVDSPFKSGFAYIDASTATSSEDAGGKTAVSVTLVNTGKEEAAVPLRWDVHYGSAVSDASIVESSVETIKVPARAKAVASHVIADSSHATYEALASAVSEGVSSFAAERVDNANSEAFVRLLGIAPKGTETSHTAFACVSNAFTDDVEGKAVALSVSDGTGLTLAQGTFPVSSSTNEMEFALPFQIHGSGDVLLSAVVTSKEGRRQQFDKTFLCTDLGTCVSPSSNASIRSAVPPILDFAMVAIGFGGLALILIRAEQRRRLPANRS